MVTQNYYLEYVYPKKTPCSTVFPTIPHYFERKCSKMYENVRKYTTLVYKRRQLMLVRIVCKYLHTIALIKYYLFFIVYS